MTPSRFDGSSIFLIRTRTGPPVLKTLALTVDKGTWPAAGPPFYPSEFPAGNGGAGLVSEEISIHIPSMLLLMGQLTTPELGPASLSEYWAQVRYLEAIGSSGDLRIAAPFAAMDAHLKTLLSDDFGMAVPVGWLVARLTLCPPIHGRYFIDRLAALAGTPPPPVAKRGPSKSPDFVCLDELGRINIIECKGTQSGTGYRSRQMSGVTATGAPTGAEIQKKVIVPLSHLQGQRLACGLCLSNENQAEASHLLITDPEPPDAFVITKEMESSVTDPLRRGALAKMLRASGLRQVADVIAAPSGRYASSRPGPERVAGHTAQSTLRSVDERRQAAEAELGRFLLLGPHLNIEGRTFIGRSLRLDLARAISADGEPIRQVAISQGVSQELLQALSHQALGEGHIDELAPDLAELMGPLKVKGDGGSAQLNIGSAFAAGLQLGADRELSGPTRSP